MSRVEEEKQVGPHDTAISKKKPFPSTFEGKLVRIVGNKLIMKTKGGQEYSHTMAENIQLTCDGTVCQAKDLKAGSKIRVTTRKDDPIAATRIDSHP